MHDELMVDGGSTESGSAAATTTATAREEAEKSNLQHEGFPNLGAPLTVVSLCFAQGLVDIYRKKNSPHPR